MKDRLKHTNPESLIKFVKNLEESNNQLKNEIGRNKRNSLYTLSEKEKEKERNFDIRHYNRCKINSIEFIVKVVDNEKQLHIKCPICNEIENITDI